MPISQIDPYYRVGTATFAATTAVVGQGTQWLANVQPGDQIFNRIGQMAIVGTVNSDTSITLVTPFAGTVQAAQVYAIYRVSDSVRVENFRQRLLNLLLGGNLTSLGGLTLAADKLLYANGEGSLALSTLSAFMRTVLDDANGAAVYGTLGQVPNAQIRSDLGADKSYRQGNILGTVSQAAGAPTGAVVERGSNANGEYVRFADGTQICTRTVNLDFTTVASYAFPHPAAFSVIPAATISHINTANSARIARQAGVPCMSHLSSWNVGVSLTSPETQPIYLAAIGRWF